MDPRCVAIHEVRNPGKLAPCPDRLDELEEGSLPFVDHGAVEQGEEIRCPRQHVAQAGHGVAADGHMDVRELLLDELAEGHRREDLLLQHDRNPDHVRPLGLDQAAQLRQFPQAVELLGHPLRTRRQRKSSLKYQSYSSRFTSFWITSWPAARSTHVRLGRLRYGSEGYQSGGKTSMTFVF